MPQINSLLDKPLTEEDVLFLHRLFFQQIDPENSGNYRQNNVLITGTDFLPPDYLKIPLLMKNRPGLIPVGCRAGCYLFCLLQ